MKILNGVHRIAVDPDALEVEVAAKHVSAWNNLSLSATHTSASTR